MQNRKTNHYRDPRFIAHQTASGFGQRRRYSMDISADLDREIDVSVHGRRA